jgi:hypothetical protein
MLLHTLLACGSACASSPPLAPPTAPGEGAFATIPGLCEASAIVGAPEGGWWVGDNETSDQLYAFGGDFSPRPPVRLEDRLDDVEALAETPGGVIAVGSQSRNKKGEVKPRRRRAAVVGRPSVALELRGCAPCLAAMEAAPGAGGLDVEGAAWWGGRIWLGLRAPLVAGKALLVALGEDLVAAPVPSAPVEVDLGGDGIRDLLPWQGGLLVLSGPDVDVARPHRLWWLATPGALPVALPVKLPPSAEGMARLTDSSLIVVTDGDGKPGDPCGAPATWGIVRVPALPAPAGGVPGP